MIRLGGMVPMTSLDFPGRLAAVLFLQGCPWRCVYCHNPHLQAPRDHDDGTAFEDVLDFLGRRRGLLDGVVFSGGEPTLQPGLGVALDAVRALGFQTALHTMGAYPRRLAELLPRLDWVGLDIKSRRDIHAGITGQRGDAGSTWHSLRLLRDSGIDYECRTTWHPRLYPESELLRLADELADVGVRHWALQRCRGEGYPEAEWTLGCRDRLAGRFEGFTVR